MPDAFSGAVTVEVDKLNSLGNDAALKIVDAAARELGVELLGRAITYLERLVYTRPNSVVTSDKMDTAPEPTGALMNSGYLKTFTGELPPGAKSQQEAESAARASSSEVVFGQAPPGPSRLGQVQVLFAVEYGLYVEMGTVFMAARPFLQPSADEVSQFAEKFVKAKLIEAGFSA